MNNIKTKEIANLIGELAKEIEGINGCIAESGVTIEQANKAIEEATNAKEKCMIQILEKIETLK